MRCCFASRTFTILVLSIGTRFSSGTFAFAQAVPTGSSVATIPVATEDDPWMQWVRKQVQKPFDPAACARRAMPAGTKISVQFPIETRRHSEMMAGRCYTIVWRGNCAVQLDPRGEFLPYLPYHEFIESGKK